MSRQLDMVQSLEEGFLQGISGIDSFNIYKDPFDVKYLGNPDRITPTQKEMWPYIRDTPGCKVALIGGKGSAKTTVGSAYLVDRIQRYPGSKGFIAASTYMQATDSCAAELVKLCNRMDIEIIYYDKKTLDNIPHKAVFYFPQFNSNICIRSADNMNMIEGSQWDFCVIEEVSFWKEGDLSTALSRLRRPVGDNSRMIVGMPAEEEHWMYNYLEENKFELREIDTRENKQNLPENYISDLLRMYPGALGERYIQGKKVSIHSMPTVPSYDPAIHRRSEDAIRLTNYDENKKLIISFDFNVAPCCATVWQIKPMLCEVLRKGSDGTMKLVEVAKYIICQIDEFEVWSGGTRALAEQIFEKYGPQGYDHNSGCIIIGDAAGNHDDTRSVSVTDWTIIQDVFVGMRDLIIRRGLVINRGAKGRRKTRRHSQDPKQSLAKYSNPGLKDSIENLNRIHIDGDGHAGIFYLQKSRFASGGAAASVSSTKYRADGSVNDSNDKLEGKKIHRTHYWATVRYLVWYVAKPGKRPDSSLSDSSNGSRDLGDVIHRKKVFTRNG